MGFRCLVRIINISKDTENIKIKLSLAGGNVIKLSGSAKKIAVRITIIVAPTFAMWILGFNFLIKIQLNNQIKRTAGDKNKAPPAAVAKPLPPENLIQIE